MTASLTRDYVIQIKLRNVCIGAREAGGARDYWALSLLASTIVFLNYQWEATSGKHV
jgi:hypothetical protein